MSFASAEAVDAAIYQLHHTLHKHPDVKEPIKLFAQRHQSRSEMDAAANAAAAPPPMSPNGGLAALGGGGSPLAAVAVPPPPLPPTLPPTRTERPHRMRRVLHHLEDFLKGGSEPWRACTAPCEIEPELRELSNFSIALDGDAPLRWLGDRACAAAAAEREALAAAPCASALPPAEQFAGWEALFEGG